MQKVLHRNLKEERAFPLLLHYDYNTVIKPRSELLRTRVKNFSLARAFEGPDGFFCKKYEIDPDVLEEEKLKRFIKKTKAELEALKKVREGDREPDVREGE